jgi:hypothetical protein
MRDRNREELGQIIPFLPDMSNLIYLSLKLKSSLQNLHLLFLCLVVCSVNQFDCIAKSATDSYQKRGPALKQLFSIFVVFLDENMDQFLIEIYIFGTFLT